MQDKRSATRPKPIPQKKNSLLLWAETGDYSHTSLRDHLENDFRIAVVRGVEAIRNFLSTRTPDMILMEIQAPPEAAAADLCRALKNDVHTLFTPLLFLSERLAPGESAALWDAGADGLLLEPDPEVLTACCRNLAEKYGRLRRYYFPESFLAETARAVSPEDHLLVKAVTVVGRHIDDARFDTRLFAREMGLSRTYLFTKIKRLTGRTPNEFVLGMRLRRAFDMVVKRPEMNMTEIAYEMGFSSPSYLIQRFKKEFGQTPGHCRKQLLPEGEGDPKEYQYR